MKRGRRLSLEHRAAIVRGNTYHGLWGTPTYNAWHNMVQSVTNPRNPRWPDYGGADITVCERWNVPRGQKHPNVGFTNFLEDMGERPEGMTLDRIDEHGNFEPGNCHWVPMKEY